MIRVCLAGATGWVGRGLVPAIAASEDLRLVAAVSRAQAGRPLSEVLGCPAPDITVSASGPREARGAALSGSQIHSVRLPGFVSSIEILFGLPDERLSIRHDSGSGAAPYVAGTLLAVRKVGGFAGLRRGLDSVMDF